jgi:hypothetical protein
MCGLCGVELTECAREPRCMDLINCMTDSGCAGTECSAVCGEQYSNALSVTVIPLVSNVGTCSTNVGCGCFNSGTGGAGGTGDGGIDAGVGGNR